MTLSNRLLYGLELAIESQIITGQGTGANMSGLTKSGNFTAFTPSSGDSALDSINRALGAIETADGGPSLVILHPLDFRAAQGRSEARRVGKEGVSTCRSRGLPN